MLSGDRAARRARQTGTHRFHLIIGHRFHRTIKHVVSRFVEHQPSLLTFSDQVHIALVDHQHGVPFVGITNLAKDVVLTIRRKRRSDVLLFHRPTGPTRQRDLLLARLIGPIGGRNHRARAFGAKLQPPHVVRFLFQLLVECRQPLPNELDLQAGVRIVKLQLV